MYELIISEAGAKRPRKRRSGEGSDAAKRSRSEYFFSHYLNPVIPAYLSHELSHGQLQNDEDQVCTVTWRPIMASRRLAIRKSQRKKSPIQSEIGQRRSAEPIPLHHPN
jgi:hypothetical protein